MEIACINELAWGGEPLFASINPAIIMAFSHGYEERLDGGDLATLIHQDARGIFGLIRQAACGG